MSPNTYSYRDTEDTRIYETIHPVLYGDYSAAVGMRVFATTTGIGFPHPHSGNDVCSTRNTSDGDCCANKDSLGISEYDCHSENDI